MKDSKTIKINKKLIFITIIIVAVITIITGIIIGLRNSSSNENSTMNALVQETETYGVVTQESPIYLDASTTSEIVTTIPIDEQFNLMTLTEISNTTEDGTQEAFYWIYLYDKEGNRISGYIPVENTRIETIVIEAEPEEPTIEEPLVEEEVIEETTETEQTEQTPIEEQIEPTPQPEEEIITKIESITLNEANLTLIAGTTKTLIATTNPETTDEIIIWDTSDANVATVSQEGKIEALKKGTATITAYNQDKTISAQCRITVTNIAVTSLKATTSSITLGVGESKNIEYEILPENATDKTVTIESSNSNIISVEGTTIKALKKGTAKLTITSNDNNSKKITVTVRVKNAPKTLLMNTSKVTLKTGETFNLEAYVNTGASSIITYQTSDENIVTINDTVLTALKEGTAVITAQTYNGKTASMTVTVTNETVEQEKTLIPSKIKMQIAKSKTLSTTLENVTWSSSDTKVATVNKNGKVTTKKVGTTTITATDKNGNKQTAEIEVIKLPTSIRLTPQNITLNIGESKNLKITYSPYNTSEKDIIWSSNNDNVTITDGVVKAIKPGTTKITAKSVANPSLTPTITVKVNPIAVTKVEAKDNNMTLGIDEIHTVKYTISPSNATNQNITLKTSDSKIVSTEENKIIPVGKGTATVTITTKDGKKTDTIKVTVKDAPKYVSLNQKEINLAVGGTFDLDSYVNTGSASYKRIYSSNNSTIAVAQGSIVKAIKPGTATIEVKTYNGKTATCIVNVLDKETQSNTLLPSENISLAKGKTKQLKTTLTGKITWKSSNTKVATVSNDGLVKSVGEGTTTITATSSTGKKQTANVEVFIIPTKMTIKQNNVTIKLNNKSIKLKAELNDVTDPTKYITWTSSDENIATVDEKGKVTLKKAGNVTITAQCTTNKSLSKKIPITVIENFVEKINLTKANITLGRGETYKTAYTITPNNADIKTTTWRSSDTKIAKVSQDGTITAVKNGTATITATTKEGYKTDKIVVTVKNAPSSIYFVKDRINISVGETYDLESTVNAGSASNTRNYTSSNESVATVKSSVVTGIKPGTSTIEVKTYNGRTRTAIVKVEDKTINRVKTLSPNNVSLKVNQSKTFKTTLTDKVTWKSSNPKVADVANNGMVRTFTTGTTTITATDTYGNKQTAEIEVIKPTTKIDIDKTSATIVLSESKTLDLNEIYTPSNATDKGVTWSSSDEKIATVDKNGKVTAKKAGTVTITAKSTKNKMNATSKITILEKIKVKNIKITGNQTVTAGQTINLTATIYPSNAANKNVTWKSSNPKVATVNSSGKVTGVDGGTATITAISKDNSNKKATYKITVKDSGRCEISSISASGVTLNYKIKCTGTSTISDTQYKVSNGSFTSRGAGWGAITTKEGSIKFKNTNAGKSVTLRVYYNGSSNYDTNSTTLKNPSCKSGYSYNKNNGKCERKVAAAVKKICSSGKLSGNNCVKTSHTCKGVGGKVDAPYANNICVCSKTNPCKGSNGKLNKKSGTVKAKLVTTTLSTKPTTTYYCNSGTKTGSGSNTKCLTSYTP